jgi:hypothetical protein
MIIRPLTFGLTDASKKETGYPTIKQINVEKKLILRVL